MVFLGRNVSSASGEDESASFSTKDTQSESYDSYSSAGKHHQHRHKTDHHRASSSRRTSSYDRKEDDGASRSHYKGGDGSRSYGGTAASSEDYGYGAASSHTSYNKRQGKSKSYDIDVDDASRSRRSTSSSCHEHGRGGDYRSYGEESRSADGSSYDYYKHSLDDHDEDTRYESSTKGSHSIGTTSSSKSSSSSTSYGRRSKNNKNNKSTSMAKELGLKVKKDEDNNISYADARKTPAKHNKNNKHQRPPRYPKKTIAPREHSSSQDDETEQSSIGVDAKANKKSKSSSRTRSSKGSSTNGQGKKEEDSVETETESQEELKFKIQQEEEAYLNSKTAGGKYSKLTNKPDFKQIVSKTTKIERRIEQLLQEEGSSEDDDDDDTESETDDDNSAPLGEIDTGSSNSTGSNEEDGSNLCATSSVTDPDYEGGVVNAKKSVSEGIEQILTLNVAGSTSGNNVDGTEVNPVNAGVVATKEQSEEVKLTSEEKPIKKKKGLFGKFGKKNKKSK